MQPPPERRAEGWDGAAFAAVVAFAAMAAFFCAGPILRAGLWLEQPSEGWNGGHALHAFSAALYPPRSALFINNYPPLWFYLTGALARVFGDPIFPGRAVALAAFIGVAAAIFALVRRLGIGASAALIGALGFVVTMEVFFGLYVGLAEPQMLAHALATAGAALAIGATRRRTVVLAALLTVAAMLVKQVVIGLPIACTIWLLLRRPRLAAAWIVTGAAAGALALGALIAAYGQPFIQNITAPRYFTWERLGTSLGLTLRSIVPLVGFAAPAALLRRRWDDALAFAALAIGAAFVSLVIFGSALGVSINIGFDLAIAASIGLAVGWERASDAFGPRAGLWRGFVAAALVAIVAIEAPRPAVALTLDPAARHALRAQSQGVVALRDRLRQLNGPVVCETLSACLWAGKPSQADLWKLRHERTLAFMDTAPLLARIRTGAYPAVVTMTPAASPRDDGHLPGLAAALAQGYRPPVRYLSAALYLPKPP